MFWQTCWNFRAKSAENFRLLSAIADFSIFSKVFFHIFFDTCWSVLKFLSKNFLRYKPRKRPPSVRKRVVFFHRKFSHEIIPLACKVQFWQLSGNFYFEFLESFTELPHVKKQGFSKKIFSMECSTGHKKCSSDNCAENVLP